jgi:hypothetical protein
MYLPGSLQMTFVSRWMAIPFFSFRNFAESGEKAPEFSNGCKKSISTSRSNAFNGAIAEQ